MPAGITITTDPLLVYGTVGLLVGAVVLALVFARPRRGLGPASRHDAANAPAGEPWMPGGDIFGQDQPPAAPEPAPEIPTFPTPPAVAPGPVMPPVAHDPWSTTEQADQQPHWDRR